MESGLFAMPIHPTRRGFREVQKFVLDSIVTADQAGMHEAWIGEHHLLGWEPIPAPDLIVAQALNLTTQIKLAPGTHLLPYHNPVELAHRVAYLDQLAEGRYMLGVGSSPSLPEAKLFGTAVYDENGKASVAANLPRTEEALDIMRGVWTANGKAFDYEGKHFQAHLPEYDPIDAAPHIVPFQKPYPPIGMAGLTPRSSTLRSAGRYGFLPMSMFLPFGSGDGSYLRGHWDAYCEGAAAGGHTPDRNNWRIAREVIVADTDDEAIELATTGPMAETLEGYFIPLCERFGVVSQWGGPTDGTRPSLEELATKHWLVGSPETVASRLLELQQQVGGFGVLLAFSYDFIENFGAWDRSLRLLSESVIPAVNAELAGNPVTVA